MTTLPPVDETTEPGYEPWEPVQFKVGDHVRIRLSGECPYSGNTEFAEKHEGCHCPCANGAKAVVGDTKYKQVNTFTRTHHFLVGFTPLLRCKGGHPEFHHRCEADFGHYAAIEMEPV